MTMELIIHAVSVKVLHDPHRAGELRGLEALHHAYDGRLLTGRRAADNYAAACIRQLRQQRLMLCAQNSAERAPIHHHLRGVPLQDVQLAILTFQLSLYSRRSPFCCATVVQRTRGLTVLHTGRWPSL